MIKFNTVSVFLERVLSALLKSVSFVLVSWGKGLYTSTVICHWTRRVPLEGARILCYVLLVKKQLFHISKFMLVAFMYFSENLRVQKGNNF